MTAVEDVLTKPIAAMPIGDVMDLFARLARELASAEIARNDRLHDLEKRMRLLERRMPAVLEAHRDSYTATEALRLERQDRLTKLTRRVDALEKRLAE